MIDILLTGGSGFLGEQLLKHPSFKDSHCIGRTRPKNAKNFNYIEITQSTNYGNILNNIDCIVYVAGRAHIMNESAEDSLKKYREINTFSALNLAKQATIHGVKRFIYISTIKVLGENTQKNSFMRFDDDPNPSDPYSVSKSEAEAGILNICQDSEMEFVIIRPPLIYGPGVKGNFELLLKLMSLPIPIPLGGLDNKRSLVSVHNVIELISICLEHPKAKNQTFHVSDDNDMSTSELLILISKAKNRKSLLFKLPKRLIFRILKLLKKEGVYERLFSSMQIDINHTKRALDWKPSADIEGSIRECVLYLKDTKEK